MRADKFLWSVRIYKTRSIAAEEISKNRVSISGQTIKPSKEIKENDVLEIKKNQIVYRFRVLSLPESRVGAKLVMDYLEDITEPEQYEILKRRREVQSYYRDKGLGRPTKKDRRDLEDFFDDDASWYDE